MALGSSEAPKTTIKDLEEKTGQSYGSTGVPQSKEVEPKDGVYGSNKPDKHLDSKEQGAPVKDTLQQAVDSIAASVGPALSGKAPQAPEITQRAVGQALQPPPVESRELPPGYAGRSGKSLPVPEVASVHEAKPADDLRVSTGAMKTSGTAFVPPAAAKEQSNAADSIQKPLKEGVLSNSEGQVLSGNVEIKRLAEAAREAQKALGGKSEPYDGSSVQFQLHQNTAQKAAERAAEQTNSK